MFRLPLGGLGGWQQAAASTLAAANRGAGRAYVTRPTSEDGLPTICASQGLSAGPGSCCLASPRPSPNPARRPYNITTIRPGPSVLPALCHSPVTRSVPDHVCRLRSLALSFNSSPLPRFLCSSGLREAPPHPHHRCSQTLPIPPACSIPSRSRPPRPCSKPSSPSPTTCPSRLCRCTSTSCCLPCCSTM